MQTDTIKSEVMRYVCTAEEKVQTCEVASRGLICISDVYVFRMFWIREGIWGIMKHQQLPKGDWHLFCISPQSCILNHRLPQGGPWLTNMPRPGYTCCVILPSIILYLNYDLECVSPPHPSLNGFDPQTLPWGPQLHPFVPSANQISRSPPTWAQTASVRKNRRVPTHLLEWHQHGHPWTSPTSCEAAVIGNAWPKGCSLMPLFWGLWVWLWVLKIHQIVFNKH